MALNRKEQIVFNYFIDKFKTVFKQSDEEAKLNAAAIVGNFIWESSGLKTDARERNDGTGGLGLAQWTGERRRILEAKPNWNNINTQLDYSWEELMGSHNIALRKLFAAKGIANKTHVINYFYEGSEDKTGNSEDHKYRRAERLRHAIRLIGGDYEAVNSDSVLLAEGDSIEQNTTTPMIAYNSIPAVSFSTLDNMNEIQPATAMTAMDDPMYGGVDRDLLDKYASLVPFVPTKKSKSAKSPEQIKADKYDETLSKLMTANDEKEFLKTVYAVEDAAKQEIASQVEEIPLESPDDEEEETETEQLTA